MNLNFTKFKRLKDDEEIPHSLSFPKSKVLRKQEGPSVWILGVLVFAVGVFALSVYILYAKSVLLHPLHIYIIVKNSSQIGPIEYKTEIDFSHSVTTSTASLTDPACSNIRNLEKYDCYPDSVAEESKCILRGCCWHVVDNEVFNYSNSKNYPPLNVPYCFYPSNFQGYKVINSSSTPSGKVVILQRVVPSGFPNDVQNVCLTISYLNESSIRLKLTDLNNERFEVPLSQHDLHEQPFNDSMLYDIQLDNDGNLNVTRKSTGSIVFSTKLSQLVYSDQLLQLSTRLPSPNIYGIGEQYDNLLRNTNWTRSTLFNRDIQPLPNKNLYGTHPFYVSVETDGNSHGVLLLNSNAMDVILQPTPALTFRTIGGILDLYVFLGPTPDQVVQQYTQVVGATFLPPYWSLGFHLCKFGYNSLNKTRMVWQRTRDAEIPFDVQWNDIDYMDRSNDFTYDKVNFKGLPEFVEEIHDNGMHYVIMVDPGISSAEAPGTYPPYDDGIKANIFVKNISGDLFVGKVWNRVSTVFPDFSHPASCEYWKNQFQYFYQQVPFDGAWIDMNEPSNFYNGQKDGCPQNSSLENPPYIPGSDVLYTKTLCMTAKHYSSSHYNEHSLYSYREAAHTASALINITGKRPFVISRASTTGQGVFGGHWSGDISSSWEDLRYSIIALLNFNIFGMSMMGSDICGFNGNTTVELCARWSAVGAFYPFSRNHNTNDALDQDPVALGPIVVEAAKKALLKRYFLLPYLYTLFYRSHAFGETVSRPLFFEYPMDVKTYSIEQTFLWGPALMIVPVLYPGALSVKAYFPKDFWYDFSTGKRINSSGETLDIDTPLTEINLYVRGGFILPLQTPNLTTTTSRQNPFMLHVVLNDQREATGELFWDDGESYRTYENKDYNLVEFSLKENILITKPILKGYSTAMPLSIIKVCGLMFKPMTVTVNGKEGLFEYDKWFDILYIQAQELSLLNSNTISWN